MRLSIIVGMGLMIVSFQNCSKTSFSSQDGALAKASDEVLVPVDTDPDSVEADEDEDAPAPPKRGHSQCQNRHPSSEDPNEEQAEASSEFVACILDGPGKSIKLGIMSNKLNGVNSVAKSVCVTENACLNLVPTAFKVKGVEDRGYCKNNPNVVRLSDAEIKGLLGI